MPASSFDEYLRTVPDDHRAMLEGIRQFVRRTVPEAEEGTSYGMPAFRYKKRPLLGFSSSKKHLSVFPFSPEVIEATRSALAGFDLSKGTIRFTPDKPIPDSVLQQLLERRMREIDAA